MPTFSILMPVYNGEEYIAAAVESVLSQTFRDLELVILDDGSKDASLRMIQEFQRREPRIRIVSRVNQGHVRTQNELIGRANGKLVAFIAQDDIYTIERLARQVAWLDANPEFDALCGSFSTIDASGRVVSDMQCGLQALEITDELRSGKVRTHISTYAFRAEALARVGGFREYFESAEDIDLQLRLGEIGRIGYVPESFYLYRLHSSSITHTLGNARREFFDRVAYDFQKQRRTSGLDDLQRGNPPPKPEVSRSPGNSAGAHVQGVLLGRAWREHGAGMKVTALGTGLRAVVENPLSLTAWKSLVALAIKRSGRTPS